MLLAHIDETTSAANREHDAVFDRIEMKLIDMADKVVFTTDGVLPEYVTSAPSP
jgi:hypothetical protein